MSTFGILDILGIRVPERAQEKFPPVAAKKHSYFTPSLTGGPTAEILHEDADDADSTPARRRRGHNYSMPGMEGNA